MLHSSSWTPGCKPQKNSTDEPTKVKCSFGKQGASTHTDSPTDLCAGESELPLSLVILQFSSACAEILGVLYVDACLGNYLFSNYNGQYQTGRLRSKGLCGWCLNSKLAAKTIPEMREIACSEVWLWAGLRNRVSIDGRIQCSDLSDFWKIIQKDIELQVCICIVCFGVKFI